MLLSISMVDHRQRADIREALPPPGQLWSCTWQVHGWCLVANTGAGACGSKNRSCVTVRLPSLRDLAFSLVKWRRRYLTLSQLLRIKRDYRHMAVHMYICTAVNKCYVASLPPESELYCPRFSDRILNLDRAITRNDRVMNLSCVPLKKNFLK